MSVSLVLDYRKTGKVALNVLVGSLEADPELADTPVVFETRDLARAIEARLAAGDERVLVAWSFYSPDFPRQAEALARIRQEIDDPRILHVAGGVHATAEPRATQAAGFDLVATGEGEETIRALVRALRRGEDPGQVKGIATRAEPVRLDDFPPFAPRHNRLGPIEITRGCIYACRFCQTPSMNKARFRHRSLENVRHWVELLARRGFRDYRFISPTSFSYGTSSTEPDLGAIESLLAMVRGIVGPEARVFYGTFPSEIRPEHVTREALAILRRFVTNRSIIIGGQSGSERILEESRRGHGVLEIERAVRIAKEEGFEPHVDFILGLPGETADDARATLALMERLATLGARVHGHTFMPLPGTPWRDEAPGVVPLETRRRLDALAARGSLYGQWKTQSRVAADLARLRGAH
ncbi:MAG TPA: TIGR04013 family B12-binding domain/radical SAM domain-containing protein [Planctomycetota bacterium]|nr:TIGR04013 family B12-binding domain/radical SAM domain-containing protein [Planctomycetota bacterium]